MFGGTMWRTEKHDGGGGEEYFFQGAVSFRF